MTPTEFRQQMLDSNLRLVTQVIRLGSCRPFLCAAGSARITKARDGFDPA